MKGSAPSSMNFTLSASSQQKLQSNFKSAFVALSRATFFGNAWKIRELNGGQGTKANPRHEDFQSSCLSGTKCDYRSLVASIQAFNSGALSLILPIRTHRDI
jgi:hypothetical protein